MFIFRYGRWGIMTAGIDLKICSPIKICLIIYKLANNMYWDQYIEAVRVIPNQCTNLAELSPSLNRASHQHNYSLSHDSDDESSPL